MRLHADIGRNLRQDLVAGDQVGVRLFPGNGNGTSYPWS